MTTERKLIALRFPRFAGTPSLKSFLFNLAVCSGAVRQAFFTVIRITFGTALIISFPAVTYSQVRNYSVEEAAVPHSFGAVGNINEQIPNQYRERYNRWKATFLSVSSGRRLWLSYAANPTFRLTISVSKSQGKGALVKDYQWNEGKLVAATIILGHELDHGYPCGPYYPVLGSLALTRAGWDDRASDVLAAAKIAHEFGHIDHAANSDATSYQVQNALSEAYVSRFLSNGYNTDDPILVELAERMGGTAPEIKGQREYWAETHALRYLLEKFASNRRRELLRWVRKSLESESSRYSLHLQAEWWNLISSDG